MMATFRLKCIITEKQYNQNTLWWNYQDKCEVIHVSKQENPLIFPYKINNTELKSTENAKYIEITISNDFKWKPHI